jgi:hypothetical protein
MYRKNHQRFEIHIILLHVWQKMTGEGNQLMGLTGAAIDCRINNFEEAHTLRSPFFKLRLLLHKTGCMVPALNLS